MKILVENYSFNPATGVITFSDYSSIKLENVLLVTNVTTNVMIYNFAVPALGGSVTGNQLDLDYNTSSMSSTDRLQIFYEETASKPASDEGIVLLRRLVAMLAPIATQDVNQRQRVTVDAISSGLTLTTVTAVGNTASLGGVDARFQFIDAARNAYANGIRQNLAFS